MFLLFPHTCFALIFFLQAGKSLQINLKALRIQWSAHRLIHVVCEPYIYRAGAWVIRPLTCTYFYARLLLHGLRLTLTSSVVV